jgi:hypothetical protein
LTAARRPAPPGNGAPDDAAAPARLAADAAGVAIGTILAAVGFVRRSKPVHPHGVSYRARLSVPGATAAPAASTLLGTPGEHDAIVRFSRSLGVARPLPDLLGMSIRRDVQERPAAPRGACMKQP